MKKNRWTEVRAEFKETWLGENKMQYFLANKLICIFCTLSTEKQKKQNTLVCFWQTIYKTHTKKHGDKSPKQTIKL